MLHNKRSHRNERPALNNWRVAPIHRNKRKPMGSSEDPAQPNKQIKRNLFLHGLLSDPGKAVRPVCLRPLLPSPPYVLGPAQSPPKAIQVLCFQIPLSCAWFPTAVTEGSRERTTQISGRLSTLCPLFPPSFPSLFLGIHSSLGLEGRERLIVSAQEDQSASGALILGF